MGKKVGSKNVRDVISRARRAGARIENGKKHIKIYDGDELVLVLPHGAKSSNARSEIHDRVIMNRRGW